MEPLVDPSAILSEQHYSEIAALEQLLAPPQQPYARARYWLGRLKVEIVFGLIGNAAVWFAEQRRQSAKPGDCLRSVLGALASGLG